MAAFAGRGRALLAAAPFCAGLLCAALLVSARASAQGAAPAEASCRPTAPGPGRVRIRVGANPRATGVDIAALARAVAPPARGAARGGVASCWDPVSPPTDPDRYGTAELSVRLGAGPTFGDVRWAGGSLAHPGTRRCVLERVAAARAPAGARAGRVDLRLTVSLERGPPRRRELPADCREGSAARARAWAATARPTRPLPAGFSIHGFRVGMSREEADRRCRALRGTPAHSGCRAPEGIGESWVGAAPGRDERGPIAEVSLRRRLRDPDAAAALYGRWVREQGVRLGAPTDAARHRHWDGGRGYLEGDAACAREVGAGRGGCVVAQWATIWTRWVQPGAGSVVVSIRSGREERGEVVVTLDWYDNALRGAAGPIERAPFRPSPSEPAR